MPPPRSQRNALRGRFSLLSLAVLLGTLTPAAAAGQQRPDPAGVTVTGRVLDHFTGAPVVGAAVHIRDLRLGAVTDAEGRFALRRVPVGEHVLTLQRLGYALSRRPLVASPGMEPLELRLVVNPVVMEGLTVMTERLERRRRWSAQAVRVLPPERLQTSGASNLMDAVLSMGGLMLSSCPGAAYERCVFRRGSAVRPTIYLDEAPVFGGLEMLMGFSPHDIHTVEVFGRGLQIRVYTHVFMERLASNPRMLRPL